jgi:hypothetical protein
VEKIQPEGVFLVGVLTVLSALGLWFFAFIIFALEQATEASVVSIIRDVGLFGGWGFLFLGDAVLVLRGIRPGYFLSMVLWFLTFACDVWYSSQLGLFSGGSVFSLGGLYLVYYAMYSIVCFVYFLRRSVRTYFGT